MGLSAYARVQVLLDVQNVNALIDALCFQFEHEDLLFIELM